LSWELKAFRVRSLCRSGSLTAFAREWSKYKFDLMGVQEFIWEKSGSELAGCHVTLYGYIRDKMFQTDGNHIIT
jgi:hypothetical protein